MGQYDKYTKLVIPANIAKLIPTSSIPKIGYNQVMGGPANEGIDLAVWIKEQYDNGTLVLIDPNVTALITLSGLPAGSVDLGAFTGTTISDNVDVVTALQELETALEAISVSGDGDGMYDGSGTIPTTTVATVTDTLEFLGATPGTFIGLTYNADYSANYTNRSLVDKEYVDSVAAAADGNGIYDGSGIIIGDTTADLSSGGSFNIAYDSTGLPGIGISDTSGSIYLEDSTGLHSVNMTLASAKMSSGSSNIALSTTDHIFTDGHGTPKGLQYNADYSATYTNRSLVDKEYVDNNAGGSSIYTASGTVPTSVVATLTDDLTFTTDAVGGFFLANVGNLFGSFMLLNETQGQLKFYDAGSSNEVIVNAGGINLNTTLGDLVTITGQDARYAADYSGTYTNRSLVDKEYVDGLIAGGGGHIIEDEGTPVTVRATLNFVGAGISASDVSSKTQISLDATLNALAGYNTNGILTQTAADTFTGRTITGTAGRVVVTDGDGVAGNPTINIDPTFGSTDLADTANIALLNGTQTFSGTNTFTNNITLNGTPLAGTDVVTVDYVDSIISALPAPSLTATQVGFGSGSNLLTGAATFLSDGTYLVINDTAAQASTTLTTKGTGTTSATFGYKHLDSSGALMFQIDNDGQAQAGGTNGAILGATGLSRVNPLTVSSGSSRVIVTSGMASSLALWLSSTGTGGTTIDSSATATVPTLTLASGNRTITSGTNSVVSLTGGFLPSGVGTGTYTGISFTGTLDQSSGHTGLTRSILIDQVLTSVANYTAVEINASGQTALKVNSGDVRLDITGAANWDLLTRNATGILEAIGNGTTGQVLTATTGGKPTWAPPGSGADNWGSQVVEIDGTLLGDGTLGNELGVDITAIDHDGLLNYVANEHIDWTQAGAGTIHTDNYIENVPTSLFAGTITGTTYAISSDGGVDDIELPSATLTEAGLLSAAKLAEINANTLKVGNISTSLFTGTVDATTYGISSDGGANDVILVEATTTTAGLLGAGKWNEIVANTAKVSNATHTGQVTGSTTLTVDQTAITDQTTVPAAGNDYVIISDTSDGGVLKKALISDFASAGGDMAAATYDPANIAEQLVGLTATQTLTNKTVIDNSFAIADDGDNTKLIAFQASGITTGTTRTLTIQNSSGTVAYLSDITGINSGTNTGDQTSIVGITGTKAEFNTALTDGDFMFVGDAPTAHTLDSHSNVTITANSPGELLKWNGSAWINNTLAEAGISAVGHTHVLADVTDITASVAEVNLLDLSGLTAGWVLRATAATTAGWGQLLGSQISNNLGWTANTGTVTSVTGGVGIDSTGGNTPSISLNLAELTVATPVTGDWIAFDDAGASRKALISNIPLSIFNNDSGWNNYTHPNHSGDVVSTGDGVTVIQPGAVDRDMLSATGSPSSGNFLRGDYTWATPAGGFADFDAAGDVGTNQTVNSADILEIIGQTGITTTISKASTTVTIEVDLDNTAVAPGSYGSATQVATFTVDQQGRLTAAGNTAISIPATAISDLHDDDTLSNASATTVASDESIKAYIDNIVVSGMHYKGGYNASTNTPALDTGSPTLVAGDVYTVTVAGTFFTEAVEVGDTIIANTDSVDAALLSDWTIVQSNLKQATESVAGFAAIATSGEITTGTNDTKFVTPLKLEGWNGGSAITTLGTITTGVWNGTAITNANLANSTISGKALGTNLDSLTIGTGLTGTSYNGSAPITINLNYTGLGNFITSASSLIGSAIATNDVIVYHDTSTGNVFQGAISDLPFTNNAGTVTSVTGGLGITSTGGATPDIAFSSTELAVATMIGTDHIVFDDAGTPKRAIINTIPLSLFNNDSGWTSNSGTVTAVSVASANGFAGSSSGGATPALTLSTTITGMLKGNGTAISAGTAGTDYSAGTSALGTGILKSTTATGALSIAIAGDFPTLNQNTTGSAATLTTARTFQVDLASTSAVSFNGSTNVTPGVTGILPVTNGGSGRNTSTTAYGLIAAGTTANGTHQTLAAGLTTQILVGGGTSALPVWTTATGTGAPVRADSPTLISPNLGTPSSVILTNATGLSLTSGVTGVLPIANGGTGQTTANAALNALLPSQATHSGKYLTTNGTDASWATVAGGGSSSGVTGSIQFSDGAGGFNSDDSNLFWDDTANQLQLDGGTSYAMLIKGDNGGINILPDTSGTSYLAYRVRGTYTNELTALTATNLDTSSTANTKVTLTTTGAGGGDPYIVFNTNDTGFAIGIDNSADELKIGVGAAPSALSVEHIRMNGVGIGVRTAATSYLTLAAGTATASTSPLKFTSGTAMTSPEDGAIEYHASHLYFTIGSTRYQLDQQAPAAGTGGIYGGSGTVASGATATVPSGDALTFAYNGGNAALFIDDGGPNVTLVSKDTNSSFVLSNSGIAVTGNMQVTGQYNSVRYGLTDVATIALDWDDGNVQSVTLGGNRTFTFANPKDGGRYLIKLTQDGTGTRTITWPTIIWRGGTAPTLTTTGGKTDLITLIYDGTSYYGDASLNY